MTRLALAFAAALAAAGCNNRDNHVDGAYRDAGIYVRAGLSYTDDVSAKIVLTDDINLCRDVSQQQPSIVRNLWLELFAADASGQRVRPTPGHYVKVAGDVSSPNGKFLTGRFQTFGFHCVADQNLAFSEGDSVELTGIDGGYRGTLRITPNVVFNPSEHFTGSFDTSSCPTLVDFARPDLPCRD